VLPQATSIRRIGIPSHRVGVPRTPVTLHNVATSAKYEGVTDDTSFTVSLSKKYHSEIGRIPTYGQRSLGQKVNKPATALFAGTFFSLVTHV
jgi:hypothetical protein